MSSLSLTQTRYVPKALIQVDEIHFAVLPSERVLVVWRVGILSPLGGVERLLPSAEVNSLFAEIKAIQPAPPGIRDHQLNYALISQTPHPLLPEINYTLFL